MFRKLFGGIVAAGVLAGALATGALAAPAASPSASPNAKPQAIHRDVFRGTVTAINETQLTVRNMNGESKTFVRTDKTQVVRGRNEPASWSAIEVNSHVRVRFETRNGTGNFGCRILGTLHPRDTSPRLRPAWPTHPCALVRRPLCRHGIGTLRWGFVCRRSVVHLRHIAISAHLRET